MHDFVDNGSAAPLDAVDKEAVRRGYQEHAERKRKEARLKKIAVFVTAIAAVVIVGCMILAIK